MKRTEENEKKAKANARQSALRTQLREALYNKNNYTAAIQISDELLKLAPTADDACLLCCALSVAALMPAKESASNKE